MVRNETVSFESKLEVPTSYDFIYNFEEFKNDALKQCHLEEEASRVSEEIDLFISRGWEKYVLLIVNTIRKLQNCRFYFPYYLGSAMDSYAVMLLTTDKRNPISCRDFLKNERKRGILFNDALRFTILFHKLKLQEISFHFNSLDLLMNEMQPPSFGILLNNTIESYIRQFGLVYSEHLLKGRHPCQHKTGGSPDTMDNLVIVSKDQVRKDDERWILSETRAVREGEAEILQKYLLLKVSVFGGL